jgi:hypothetical protein
MSDVVQALVELRDVGVGRLPEMDDGGDCRVRSALEREMAGRTRSLGWARRRMGLGGFAVTPVVALAIAATAAAATTAAIAISATSVFQQDPQGLNVNGSIETVLGSTVRSLATITIPAYGQVTVWGASTKPGGFCFALKLPDGDWGGFHESQDTQDGWHGGSIPGCFQTQQQQILREVPVKPGRQPSGATGQILRPQPLEDWDNEIVNHDGQEYTLFIGYVEANGPATSVRDSATQATAQVLPGGYYVLAEPTPHNCGGCDANDLQVLNAAGQPLKPDYTWGVMLPGHSPGPSQS